MAGVSEKLSRVFKRHGVNTYHKPTNTLRSQLVKPKDPTDKCKKCGVIYQIKCDNCEAIYIGETSRSLGLRIKEHQKTHTSIITAVGEHCKSRGHSISSENVKVLGSETDWLRRKIHESLEIHHHGPSLNREGGFELAAIYNTVWSRDDSIQSHVTNEPSIQTSVE